MNNIKKSDKNKSKYKICNNNYNNNICIVYIRMYNICIVYIHMYNI